MEIDKYLEVGLLATKKAKEILLNYFEKNKNLKIDEKSKNDFVTQADKESEKAIIDTILEFFPNHKIYAEESEHNLDKLKDGDIIWIIDPLDGTKNFIHHIPIFGTSIGVAKFSLKYEEGYYPFKKGYIKLLTGIINLPVLDELFFCKLNEGAYKNFSKIKVSSIPLSKALVATGFPFRLKHVVDKYLKSFKEVFLKVAGIRRMGSAAIDLAYTAAGHFDAFWEHNLHPWDIAAGILLIKEAGGEVSDFLGKNNMFISGNIIGTNKVCYNEFLNIIKNTLGDLEK